MNGWDPVGSHPLTTTPLTIKSIPSNDIVAPFVCRRLFRPVVVIKLIIVMLIRNVRGVIII
jgi:hypothetical protein